MKNNFITKIIGATLAFAMMIGGAVGINTAKEAKMVDATAGEEFQLVKDASTLAVDDRIVIGSSYSGNIYLLSTTQNNNNRAATGTFTVSNDKITLTDAVQVLTLGQTNSHWTFNTGSGYLYAASSSNNYLKTQANNNANGEWTISIANNGAATVTAQGTNTRNILKYNANNGNPIFSCYNTSGTVAVYKEVVAKTLSSISVATAPTKTTYYAGEYFDPTGLVITRTYSDSTSDTYAYANHAGNFAFAPNLSTALTTDDVSVTITHGGKATTQAITVNPARTLSSISISGYETSFDQGDDFVFGGTVTANYSNSTTADVTSSATFTGYNMANVGNQTVTVSYTESGVTKTATYSITINPVTSVTFDATSDSGTSPLAKRGVSFSCSNGVLDNGSEYRLYKNSTTTISSNNRNIARIDFTCPSENPASGFASQVGWTTNGNNGTWTGDSSSVSFTASGAQVRATSIVVTFVSTEQTVEVNPSSVALKTNQLDGVLITATTHNIDNPTFEWGKNNNNITLTPTENENEIIVKPNTEIDSSAKVILTVGGADPELDPVEINVTISVPGPGETAETPFTVAQARAHIQTVVTGGEETGDDGERYYATGIVSQIVSGLSSGAISYNLSSDGLTSGEQLQVYKGKGIGGANFANSNDITVGDKVVVYGLLSKHNDTYQFSQNSQLVSRATINSIALTPSAITLAPNANGNVADLFTSIVINQDEGLNKTANDIVWSVEDESVLLIDGGEFVVMGEHRDSTTINASLNGKIYGSATINVIDPNIHSISYNTTSLDKTTSIAVGNKIVFVYENGNTKKELTSITTFGVASDYVDEPSCSYLLTVVAGSANNSVAFKTNDNHYLSWSSGNTLGTNDEVNSASSWTITNNTGNFKFTNVGTTSRVLQYNSSSPRFACYEGSQSAFQIYKKVENNNVIDFESFTEIKSAHEDENGAYIRLGVSLSEEDWAAMDSAFGIAGYGVMLIRETTLEATAFDTIAELYNSNDTENKAKLSNRGKNSETAPQDFSVAAKISISNDSDRAVVFCAATYVKASDGTIYFINETRGSLVGLL